MAISVSASTNQCGQVSLSWSNPQGTVYNVILRGTTVIYSGNAKNSHVDYVDPGNFTYTVEAYDTYWDFIDEGSANGTSLGPPPYNPSSVSASDNYCDRIEITWSNPDFNDYEKPTHVRISRNGQLIQTLDYPATSYTDYPPVGSYTYDVYYTNSCGGSPGVTSDTGIRIQAPQSAANNFDGSDVYCGYIRLSWANPTEPNTSPREGWKLYRGGQLIQTLGPNETGYDDYVSAGIYNYEIRPYNSCGDGPSAYGAGTSLGVPTTNVSNLSAQLISGPAVKLTYTAGDGDYRRIYRKTGAGGQYSWLQDTTDPSQYIDSSVQQGNTYYYKMREANSCGEMETYSDEVSIYVGNIYSDEISEAAQTIDSISDNVIRVDILTETSLANDSIVDIIQYNDILSETIYTIDSLADVLFRTNRFAPYLGDSTGKIYKLSETEPSDAGIGFDFKWVSKVFDILGSPEEKDLFKTIRRVEVKYRDLGATHLYFYVSIDGGLTWIPASNNPIPLAGMNDNKIKSVFADVFVTGKTLCFMIKHGEANKDFSLLDLEIDYQVRGFIKQEGD